ncbi:MAG: fructosamine kinase family protein [Longimicrobiales bacterium]
MNLPASIRSEVEATLTTPDSARIAAVRPVGGGCISPAARIELGHGESLFLKWDASGQSPETFFAEEARSLRELAKANAVRTPAVLGVGPHWLLLEWLEPGRARDDTWAALGRKVAALHRTQGRQFGWAAGNFIGSLPQSNRHHAHWPDFWREQRLLPQWTRARQAGYFDAKDERAFDRMLAGLDALLAAGDMDGPSLLHGDLWSGNIHIMTSGEAALVDPCSAYGHREVDLAMAALFGGFDRAFFDAYAEAWPLAGGSRVGRRNAYQLYYLLVHVNLFGEGYAGGVRNAIARTQA